MKMTFMTVAVAATVAFPAFSQEAASPPVWGIDDVDHYIETNRPRSTSEVADPFAVPPTPIPPAELVVLRFPVYMDGTEPTFKVLKSATWKYDAATQTMELTTYPASGGVTLSLDFQGVQMPGPSYTRPVVQGVNVFEDRKTSDAGTGQNAYGAKVEMTRIQLVNRGIGELVGSILDKAGPQPDRGEYKFTHSWRIAPEDARSLSQNIQLEIVAATKPWAPGKWIVCGDSYSGATVRNPTILSASGCYLTAEFTTLRFVDKRDGTVLREWVRPSGRFRR